MKLFKCIFITVWIASVKSHQSNIIAKEYTKVDNVTQLCSKWTRDINSIVECCSQCFSDTSCKGVVYYENATCIALSTCPCLRKGPDQRYNNVFMKKDVVNIIHPSSCPVNYELSSGIATEVCLCIKYYRATRVSSQHQNYYRQLCIQDGTSTIRIDSAEKQAAIEYILRNAAGVGFWAQGHWNETYRQYQYDDGTPMVYDKWCPNCPVSTDPVSVHINTKFLWYSRPTDVTYLGIVCEIHLE